jgi:putative oxidoreductase
MNPQALARSLTLVRVAVAVLLGIHGHYRLWTGGAWLFGEWLTSRGLPFGAGIAWAITLFEVAATAALAAGRLVVPACLGHAAILTAGIVMVHAPHGWWVVGPSRNGVEYSVLLLACLAAIGSAHWRTER